MLPDRLILGDTLNFTTSVADYPASDGWTLKYRLVPRGTTGTAVEISGAADADDPSLHRVQVSASTTALWIAAVYSWLSWVEYGTEKYSVGTGAITLVADPRSASSSFELRTDAEIALDDARAALAAYTPTQRSYRIGDRSMEFASKADIVAIVNYWENVVRREHDAAAMAAGRKGSRKLYVRFAGRG